MNARALRVPVAAVVAVSLAVGGWLVWRHATGLHEHVTAARGEFPAPLGNGAPSAPDRVVRQTSDSYGVDGALSIDGTSDGIVARDLRSGRDYWRYGRDGTELGQAAVAGDTIATWWKDGVVVATDLRTGKPRWHAAVPYGRPHGSSEPGFAWIGVVDGLVVTESRDRITAFAADDGERAWKGAIPGGCVLDYGSVIPLGDAMAARAHCSGTTDHASLLLGFDSHRGTLRWRLTDGLDQLLRADDHTLVTSAWTTLGQGAVVDVSGTEPVVSTRPFPAAAPLLAVGAGLMLGEDRAGTTPQGTLEAFDVANAQPEWTRQPATGTRFGRPLIADGRVYVVQQPDPSGSGASGSDGADLLVLDAATGRQLHTTRLPALPPDSVSQDLGIRAELAPRQVGDGLVVIGWVTAMFASPTHDLLVVSG